MKLAEIRKGKGLSQSQLSFSSCVPVGTIRNIEQSRTDVNHADVSILYKLAKALNCSIEDLLEVDNIE